MELSYLFAFHSSTVRHIIYIIIVYNIFRRKKQFLTLNWDHLFVPSVNGDQGSYENGKISAILSILDTPVLFCLGHLLPSPKRDIFFLFIMDCPDLLRRIISNQIDKSKDCTQTHTHIGFKCYIFSCLLFCA